MTDELKLIVLTHLETLIELDEVLTPELRMSRLEKLRDIIDQFEPVKRVRTRKPAQQAPVPN